MGKTKKKKKIKRKPGKKSKLYFTNETQKAIEEYQVAKDGRKKHRLVSKEIIPAFRELAENLIFVFRFKSLHDTPDELLNDCVSFLYENINKFDPTKGFKAYSYFSIVAKNYLMIRSKKRTASIQRHLSIDDPEAPCQEELQKFENTYIEEPEAMQTQEKFEKLNEISNLFFELKSKLTNSTDIECLEAIKIVFENLNNLDLLKKRALIQYAKENTNLTNKQFTFALTNIKRQYREIAHKYKFKIFSDD